MITAVSLSVTAIAFSIILKLISFTTGEKKKPEKNESENFSTGILDQFSDKERWLYSVLQ